MTLAELLQLFEQRRQDAETAGYLAPVAQVYATVLADLTRVSSVDEGGRLLDVREAAERLRMSEGYVYDHAHEIGCTRFGRTIRFTAENVKAFHDLKRMN